MAKSVLVPIAQGTEEMEAVIIIDMLRRANIGVTVVADSNIVTCSRGIKILPDMFYQDLNDEEEFDAIILPGGKQGVDYFFKNQILHSILFRHINNNGLVGAICAAPTLLYDLRILKEGTSITSHPDFKDLFKEFNYSNNSVVVSNGIISSRGAGTTFDFILQIIDILVGSEIADKVKEEIVYQI